MKKLTLAWGLKSKSLHENCYLLIFHPECQPAKEYKNCLLCVDTLTVFLTSHEHRISRRLMIEYWNSKQPNSLQMRRNVIHCYTLYTQQIFIFSWYFLVISFLGCPRSTDYRYYKIHPIFMFSNLNCVFSCMFLQIKFHACSQIKVVSKRKYSWNRPWICVHTFLLLA